MEEYLPKLLSRLVETSPWIAGPIILTALWRNEILAFLFKMRPSDDIGKTIDTMMGKQDAMIEMLETIQTNSSSNGTSLAVLTALLQQRR